MKYIQRINELIVGKTSVTEGLVLFGQNIAAGSCLSGLTRNLKVGKEGLIINTQNSENTLAGLGFGMMLDGVSSVFFMKQLDFLLLGIDQLVHTYNFIRRNKPNASYTIVCIVSDLGYHGLQSSFNNFGDLCSIARIQGFNITNAVDAEAIINTHLVAPGFRIIGVSQRLFGKELSEVKEVYSNAEKTLFQYTEGNGATIACFNLSFPYGLELHSKLKERNVESSLFSVNSVTPINWDKLIVNAKKTKKLVVLDDGKSENLSYDNFLARAASECGLQSIIVIKRKFDDASWLYPNADELPVDYDAIVSKISS
ncbi:MAG: hypothetical protein NUV98_06540 [Candidatus Roizmanbacteria bacterium]|nr:hypothetical protein [Candidatus Roizmanbacteria bacterium]